MVEFKRFTTNTAIKILEEFGYLPTEKITLEDARKMKEMYPDNVYLVEKDAEGKAWISFQNTTKSVATYEVETVEDFEVEEIDNETKLLDVFESVKCKENEKMTNKAENIYKKFEGKIELKIAFSESLKAPSRPSIVRELESAKNEHDRLEEMITSMYHFELLSRSDTDALIETGVEKYMEVHSRFLEVLKKCID